MFQSTTALHLIRLLGIWTDGSRNLVPATQAAKKLGISRQSLRRLISRREVKAVKVGNLQRVYIAQGEIDPIVGGRNFQAQDSAEAKLATPNENLRNTSQPVQPVTDDFDRALADVESINIFAGPNADQWNRVLARAEGERLKETR